MNSTKTMRVYTQGLTLDMEADGSFESRDRGELTCEEVCALVRMLPMPPAGDRPPRDICPPAVGFSRQPVCPNVCRIESGKYGLFDETSFVMEPVAGGRHVVRFKTPEVDLDSAIAWVCQRYYL